MNKNTDIARYRLTELNLLPWSNAEYITKDKPNTENQYPNTIIITKFFFYRSGTQTPQQIFLINLSVAEAIINFLQLLTNHSPPVVNTSDSYSITTGVHLIDAQSNTTVAPVLPMNSTLLSRTGEWKYRELENRIYGTGKVHF